MPNFFIRLKDGKQPFYLEWSTVSDRPASDGMTEDDLLAFIKERDGTSGCDRLRNSGLFTHGVQSIRNTSPREVVSFNRAGPKESSLSMAKLVAEYSPYRKMDEQ